MKFPGSKKAATARRLRVLLEDIDRAGYIRGTASRLDWLRLKTAGAGAKALYALLAEIHRLGLIAGTEADARWHLIRPAIGGGTAASRRPIPRCHATFLFWRGLQLQHAAGRAARHSYASDGG